MLPLASLAVYVFYVNSAFAEEDASAPTSGGPPGLLGILTTVGNFLSPTGSQTISAEEWNSMTIIQRLLAYDWAKEGIIVSMIGGYLLLYVLGTYLNKRKVNSWVNTVEPYLREEFYQVGVTPKQVLLKDAASRYTTYATGRLNIGSLLVKFNLLGRDNFITLILEYVLGFFFAGKLPKEEIDIIIKPSAPIQQFIFGLVNKDDMKEAREENYYLALTRTLDSPKIPPYFTFMTEANDLIDTIMFPELYEALEKGQEILKFLAVTDQPANRPEKLEDTEPSTYLVLTLRFPTSAAEHEATKLLVQCAVKLVDRLVEMKPFRAETTKKIRATREAEQKKITKLLDVIKAEENAAKKADIKREQIKKDLSPAEQRKKAEKEEKRKAKKMQKRMR